MLIIMSIVPFEFSHSLNVEESINWADYALKSGMLGLLPSQMQPISVLDGLLMPL